MTQSAANRSGESLLTQGEWACTPRKHSPPTAERTSESRGIYVGENPYELSFSFPARSQYTLNHKIHSGGRIFEFHWPNIALTSSRPGGRVPLGAPINTHKNDVFANAPAPLALVPETKGRTLEDIGDLLHHRNRYPDLSTQRYSFVPSPEALTVQAAHDKSKVGPSG